MYFGCSKRFTVPDHPVLLEGYGNRCDLSARVEDPIELGVMALGRGDDTVLIVSADICGVGAAACDRIYRILEEKFGLDREHVWISASHTHFAPGFSRRFICERTGTLPRGFREADESYFQFWCARMLDAAEAALNSREEVAVEFAAVEVPGVAFNRRTVRKVDGMVDTSYIFPENPEKYEFQPFDSTLYAWRFRGRRGLKAVLGCYGCHAVTGGLDRDAISGDWPWHFKRAAEEAFHCPAFFVLGAAGDVVPRLRGATRHGKCFGAMPRRATGEILARTLQLNELNFRPVPDELESGLIRLPVESGVKGDAAELKKQLTEKLADPAASAAELYSLACRLSIVEENPGGRGIRELRLLRFGGRILCGLPFEVLSAITIELQKRHAEIVPVTLTGGYFGYLPPASEFARGGYEVTEESADNAPPTGDDVIGTIVEYIESKLKKND